jgi:transcription elongation factor Elf1
MTHQKIPRTELKAYLDWLHTHACCFCGSRDGVQAHHVELRGMGGARRNDATCIPVCAFCHMRCHGQVVNSQMPIEAVHQWANVGAYLSWWIADLTADTQAVPW